MKKVQLNKKKCQQGLDGMNLELALGLEDMEYCTLPPEELKNDAGNTIVKIERIQKGLKVYVNVVHCIRPNNVKPFGIVDMIKLELVRNQVTGFIREYLQKHLEGRYSEEMMTVTGVEVNVTMPCVGGATPSEVISLLDLALDKTVVFRKHKWPLKYEKVNTGCLFSKPKEYRLKIYDKTEEQHQKGHPLVEKNLLRIEVVFIDRSLRRMFKTRRSLLDVLSAPAIEMMYREYKRILEEEIIDGRIKPCLTACMEELVSGMESAATKNGISETIAKHKERILDTEILRKALKRWYDSREKEDISKQVVRYYRKSGLGLPEGVLRTLRAFHDAAG